MILPSRKIDPIKFGKELWPHVEFYREQRDVIYSVEENDQTFVVAANMVGKDFVAAFIALKQFLTNKVVRIVTTSVKDDHLRVLWGEIGRFIQTAKYPLLVSKGGILIHKHQDLRKVVGGLECRISYCRGMVSKHGGGGEGMAGHHAPYTLAIIDEASGVDDEVMTQIEGWAQRVLVFGNPNPCRNFFYKAIKQGDILADAG